MLVVRKHSSLLVIDEAACCEGLDELWTGLYPTLSTGGRLHSPIEHLISGLVTGFHQAYVDAEQQQNDFFNDLDLSGCSP